MGMNITFAEFLKSYKPQKAPQFFLLIFNLIRYLISIKAGLSSTQKDTFIQPRVKKGLGPRIFVVQAVIFSEFLPKIYSYYIIGIPSVEFLTLFGRNNIIGRSQQISTGCGRNFLHIVENPFEGDNFSH